MKRHWTQRSWGVALLVPLTLALSFGAGACSADSDEAAPVEVDPSDDPGGKADNPNDPNQSDFMDLAMEALPELPGRMDVARKPAGEWFFRLVGPGGDIFLTSNSAYQQKVSSLNGMLSVEENGVFLDRYRVKPINDVECSFELRAANNQVIANGPVFRDCQDADARIEATRDLIAGVVQFKAAVSHGARFDLWREESDSRWYFALRAEDLRVLLESQAYTARTGAINGIESVRLNGKLPERYRLVTNNDGTYSISLRAANHHEIAEGGPYMAVEEAEAVIGESTELLQSERVANPW